MEENKRILTKESLAKLQEELDELTRGAVILGVDPVDYPLTDGIYIYMKLPAGDVIALLIESNGQGGDYETLRISKTAIK